MRQLEKIYYILILRVHISIYMYVQCYMYIKDYRTYNNNTRNNSINCNINIEVIKYRIHLVFRVNSFT